MQGKTLLAIDTNQDANRLEITVKLMKRYILQKQQLNPAFEIGILMLTDSTVWLQPFTADQKALFSAIDMIPMNQHISWDVSSLLDAVKDCLPVEDSEQTLQIILVYSRSNTLPACSREQMTEFYANNLNVCVDILYLHDKPAVLEFN